MPLVLIKHCVETQAQKLVSYVFLRSAQISFWIYVSIMKQQQVNTDGGMHVFFVYIPYICVLGSSHTTSTFHTLTSILHRETMIVFQRISDKFHPVWFSMMSQFCISSNNLVTSSHNIRGTFQWWQPSLLIGRMGFSVMQHYPAPCCVLLLAWFTWLKFGQFCMSEMVSNVGICLTLKKKIIVKIIIYRRGKSTNAGEPIMR